MRFRYTFIGVMAALSFAAGCDRSSPVDAGSMGFPDSNVMLMDGGEGTDAGPGPLDAGPPGDDAGGGTDAGGGSDAGPGMDAGGGTDAGGGSDAGPGVDGCTPAACGTFDCGTIDDGCGATVDCGLCGLGAACAADGECQSGDCSTESEIAWHGGHCNLDCRADADCGAGYHCGFTRNSLGRVGSCLVDCSADTDCRGPEYTCHQADADGPTECAPVGIGAGVVGDACTTNADCSFGEDWICLGESAGFNDGSCTRACMADAECGADAHCAFRPDPGSEGICMPNCTSSAECRTDGYVCTNADDDASAVLECFPGGTGAGAVGAPCTGTWDCGGGANGTCFAESAGIPGGFCSIAECMTDAECGASAHCSQYPRTGGGTIGFCFPDCMSDADCRMTGGYGCYDDNDDMVTECYVAGTGTGVVGAACTDVRDCAGGGRAACGTGVTNGYCFITGCTTAGGAGEDCPMNSHCSITLDATTGMPNATGFCLADCRSDSDCAMDGQRCYDNADIDGVTECNAAATGPGDVGDVCATYNDCSGDEFGFCLLDLDAASGLPDFPGGYCTRNCGAGGTTCPSGSTCVGSSFCVRDCTSGGDCRAADYSCVSPPVGAAAPTACWPN